MRNLEILKVSIAKLTLLFCITVLTLIFLYNPHQVEITTLLETWFPYKGLIPYRDFAMYHFPLGRAITFPLHVITNWNIRFDPFIALGLGTCSLILIYTLAKKILTPLGNIVSLLFFTLFFWYFATGILYFHEILIGFLLIASLLLLFTIHTSKKLSLKKTLWLGVLLSLTELSGQLATITILFFIIIFLILVHKNETYKKKFDKCIAIFTLGLSIPWIITLLYFYRNEALSEFLKWNITYYLTYNSNTRDLSGLPFKDLIVFYLPAILSLILLTRKKLSSEHLIVFLLTLSTIPFILFSIFHPHHLNYALPILAINAGFAFNSGVQTKLQKFLSISLIAAIVFMLLNVVFPWHKSHILTYPDFKISNLETKPGDSDYNVSSWLKNYTQTNDKIMVLGDSSIYFSSDRLPASRPSKGMPYSWVPLGEIEKEIKSSRGSYWIIDRHFIKRLTKEHGRSDIENFINLELENCYKEVVTFETWEIWRLEKVNCGT